MRSVFSALVLALALLLCQACAGFGQAEETLPVQTRIEGVVPQEPVLSSSTYVPASRPVRLSIPSIGLDKPVLDERACDRLNPESLTDVYWLTCRSMPASDAPGPVRFLGHGLADGTGAFNPLMDIELGATITVTTQTGVLNYRVTAIRTYQKGSEIQRDPDMNRKVPGTATLVTCYVDSNGATNANFVVFASLV